MSAFRKKAHSIPLMMSVVTYSQLQPSPIIASDKSNLFLSGVHNQGTVRFSLCSGRVGWVMMIG